MKFEAIWDPFYIKFRDFHKKAVDLVLELAQVLGPGAGPGPGAGHGPSAGRGPGSSLGQGPSAETDF